MNGQPVIRKIDLARAAGVLPAAITHACKHALSEAMTPNGKRIYAEHPSVLAYLRKHRGPHKPEANLSSVSVDDTAPPAARTEPGPRVPIPSREPFDPFAIAAKVPLPLMSPMPALVTSAPVPALVPPTPVTTLEPDPPAPTPEPPAPTPEPPAPTPEPPAPLPDASVPPWELPPGEHRTLQALSDFQQYGEGRLPDDLEDLGDLTLRYVAEHFGTLSALRDVVRAMKDHATMTESTLKAAKSRGTLVDRATLAASCFAVIDLATKRLVNEAPQALTEQVIARVMGRGEDLKMDTETLIRDEISGILTDCRDSVTQTLREGAAQ